MKLNMFDDDEDEVVIRKRKEYMYNIIHSNAQSFLANFSFTPNCLFCMLLFIIPHCSVDTATVAKIDFCGGGNVRISYLVI